MLPNTAQTGDPDLSQDQPENERQPLIQPRDTYPRFLTSTLGVFQQLYHSITTFSVPSGPTAEETVRPSMIFRGWYPSNSTTVPSSKSAERNGKRLREEDSPSVLRITEQAAGFENCDARPQKRQKEAASTTCIAEQEATAVTASRSAEQINTTQVFDNTIEDRGIHDRYKELTSGGSAPRAQHHDESHDLNVLRSDYCETAENRTSTLSVPNVTTHKVTSFQGAHDFTIRDSAHITNVGVNNVSNVNNYGRTFDLDIMKIFMEEFVSFDAVHDSPVQDPTRQCHPETRRGVLKQLKDWFDDSNATESIFWLHGPAGVGKSAIAQTIARSFSRDKVPATFFFYRSNPSRNDGNRLFTTLAWQLALSIPGLKPHIIDCINERPDLPRKDLETQFQELIVKPLQALTSASSKMQLSSLVIIIDGVDECVDEKLQRRFLKVIGSTVNDRDFPLRFLICSRPEVHIEEVINSFQCAPRRLDLANLSDAYHDIEKYFRAEFSRIASKQDLDPTWPGDERLWKCVTKSSGHFIYASTLIKIIDDEYESATTQLDLVLGLKPHGGKSLFAELDSLYMEILKRQRDWAFLNDIFSIFIDCILSASRLSSVCYAQMMNIPEKELVWKLRGMRSLLKIGSPIDVHHRTFLDFLQDPSRSGQYYINERAAQRRYLDLIMASIVRHVPIVFEQPDCHEQHFHLSFSIGNHSALSVGELQQALQPLVLTQDKLLTIERDSWQQVLRCNECNILSNIRELVLYLTCHKETAIYNTAHPTHEVIAVVSDLLVEQTLTEHPAMSVPPTPLVATEVENVVLEKSELDVCLSSVLDHLRETKLRFPPSTTTIHLMCSLLNFDYVETALRVRSISDGQLLVDVIDYLINNEDFLRQHNTTIACGAARLALEVFARVPVLPRSLFCLPDLSQDFRREAEYPKYEFMPMFMGRILDPNYVFRSSCMSNGEGQLKAVYEGMNKCQSIGKWRRSNPSSVRILQVMVEVAKAVRYFDAMGLILRINGVHFPREEKLRLDSECHVKVFPWMFDRPSTPDAEDQDWNFVFRLGKTFYELYFGVQFPSRLKDGVDQDLQDPEPPSEPEISEELWQIIRRCCTSDPKSRPTIDEIVQEMESLKLD